MKKILAILVVGSVLLLSACGAGYQTPTDDVITYNTDDVITYNTEILPVAPVSPVIDVTDSVIIITNHTLNIVDSILEAQTGICHKNNRIGKSGERTSFENKPICGIILHFEFDGYTCAVVDDVRSFAAFKLLPKYHRANSGGMEIRITIEGAKDWGYWTWASLRNGSYCKKS